MAATLYFSDCQSGAAAGCVPGSNANPGTQAAPKQSLAGINVNALGAGSRLLFARGGAWNWSNVRLENMNVTAAAPLVFDAYGSGALPLINAGGLSGSAIDIGSWNNTSDDGGYTFRNIKLDGKGTSNTGIFFMSNVHDIVVDSMEITGFQFGIQSHSIDPYGVHGVRIVNNSISRNPGMGILGGFDNAVIEGNLFEANNFSGSGFEHGTYLSGGNSSRVSRNVTLRNNRYLNNSVVNGLCTGGQMTFHGQFDGLLIEGNTIDVPASAPGCWHMSITQGYASAEGFLNVVVRNNKSFNAGNTGFNAQSAPGALFEGNVLVNTAGVAISVGHSDYQGGDIPDGNAIVRNNTACFPGAQGSVVRVTAPNSTVTNNVAITGAAASTGVCAR